MKERLASLLAGECTHSEEMKLRTHLAGCSGCSIVLEELKAVDSLLDLLEDEKAPGDLWGSIMYEVEKTAENRKSLRAGYQKSSYSQHGSSFTGLLRDIVTATAVALTAFWLGTGWLEPVTSTTEGKVSGAVTSYIRYTGAAVNMTQETITEINSGLFTTAEKLNPIKFETGSDN